ncbi:MAG: hypothetical protein ABIH42_11445 [Planctomycetota bacterium]
MRLFKAGYKDRKGTKRKSSKWYIEFGDHLQTVRQIHAFTDKKATEEFGRNLEKLVVLKSAEEPPDTELTILSWRIAWRFQVDFLILQETI